MVEATISKRLRGRFGVLFCVGALFLGSAVLRLGTNVGPAVASALKSTNEVTTVKENPEKDRESLSPEGLERMLKEIRAKEVALNERENELEDRLKAIKIADEAIERKLSELLEVEESLKATLALADGAAEADISRLVDVYEKMKAKDAAALFEEMDPAFASGFLARMNAESAAGIMAKLSPLAAYTISAMLAGRNAEVPTE
ncbi:hypothetical protein GI582_11780 [Sulfitobacter sp. BDSS02]|nr:hypothetical protein [Sulfitobacter sp. BDSS02]MBR9848591.1 hypothetical protein [Paracoccaceae bacterium]